MVTVYYYPACDTCKKAVRWLENHDIEVELKHIVEETPSAAVLQEAFVKSGLPMNRLLNTSGKKYRELGMREARKTMSEDEMIQLLSSEGMLIKRPVLIGEDFAFFGFKENEWEVKVG